MFSGVNSTIETISNSELIDALLEHFALKMVVRNYDKTLTKKFENNVWISKILAWMNCMTEVIIWVQKFFCFGHFLIIFSKMMDQKETPAKKDSKMKNYFFHARQPCAEIFYFCAQQNCILTFLYRGAIIYESPCIYL